MNRRMPNGTYGGVRGKETKAGQKTFVSRPTRFVVEQYYYFANTVMNVMSDMAVPIMPTAVE